MSLNLLGILLTILGKGVKLLVSVSREFSSPSFFFVAQRPAPFPGIECAQTISDFLFEIQNSISAFFGKSICHRRPIQWRSGRRQRENSSIATSLADNFSLPVLT